MRIQSKRRQHWPASAMQIYDEHDSGKRFGEAKVMENGEVHFIPASRAASSALLHIFALQTIINTTVLNLHDRFTVAKIIIFFSKHDDVAGAESYFSQCNLVHWRMLTKEVSDWCAFSSVLAKCVK